MEPGPALEPAAAVEPSTAMAADVSGRNHGRCEAGGDYRHDDDDR